MAELMPQRSDDAYATYCRLQRDRPDLFSNRNAQVYPISTPDPEVSSVLGHDRFALLIRDKVRFPDGSEGGYLRMISPPDASVGVGILPVNGDKILLLRHPRHATGEFHWEIPRGFGEAGQTITENASRELFEETGCIATELISLGSIHPDTGMMSARVELFLARLDKPAAGTTCEPGIEHDELSITEVFEMAGNGEITDSFTLVALLRAKLKGLI